MANSDNGRETGLLDPLMIALISVVLSAMVLFVLFALPIHAYRTFRISAAPIIEPVRLVGELPEEVEAFFRRTATSLVTHGFRDRIDPWYAEFAPDREHFLCLLENPIASDWLVMIASQPKKKQQGPSEDLHTSLEFRTWYLDGHRVVTRNRIGNPFGGYWQEHPVLELPTSTDAAALYRAHMAMLDRYGGLTRKEDRGTVNPLTWLRIEWERELDAGIEAGFLRTLQAESYGYTWKGAFLSVWLTMWPLAELRHAIHHWQSTRQFRQLKPA